ncbi:MAG: hypothetical protein GXP41_03360 [Chloroflexi bacterium]|nr:hypothetical protein [Chloroflexota bacterium]
MVKLLMTWDIRAGHESTYLDYITSEFAPALIRLGLEPTEAWYTVYGQGPQILAGSVTNNIDMMRKILKDPEWEQLQEQLLQYVENFNYKVVPATGRFQL